MQSSSTLGVDEVGLVPHEQHRHVAGVDLAQHGVDRGDPALGVGRARVDHVQQQIGVDDLFERRAERVDELVRQPAHEPDRVGEQHGLAAGQPQAARRRVERREQLVLDEHARVGEPVEQRRLAGVGVADERDRRQVAPAPGLALRRRGVAPRSRRSRSSRWMRRSRRRRSTSSCVSPGPAGADAATLLAELHARGRAGAAAGSGAARAPPAPRRPGSSRAGRRCRGSTRRGRRRRP